MHDVDRYAHWNQKNGYKTKLPFWTKFVYEQLDPHSFMNLKDRATLSNKRLGRTSQSLETRALQISATFAALIGA